MTTECPLGINFCPSKSSTTKEGLSKWWKKLYMSCQGLCIEPIRQNPSKCWSHRKVNIATKNVDFVQWAQCIYPGMTYKVFATIY